MTPERRQRALHAALVTTGIASGVVLLCACATLVSPWFAVVGTGACVIAAGGAFYGAFEGFDEVLRRGP